MDVVIQLDSRTAPSRRENRLRQRVREQDKQIIRLETQIAEVVDKALDLMLLPWSINQTPPPTNAELHAKREELRHLLMQAALNATKEGQR